MGLLFYKMPDNKRGQKKCWKYVRYCLACKKKFSPENGNRFYCRDCNPRFQEKEKNV